MLACTSNYKVKIERDKFIGGGMAAKQNSGNKVPVLVQYSHYLEFTILLHCISFTFFQLVQVSSCSIYSA